MKEASEEQDVIPCLAGVLGSVLGFSYGMKRDAWIIDKAINTLSDPKEIKSIKEAVSRETNNLDYPYISANLRSKLSKTAGHSTYIPAHFQSPLGFCILGGLATFLGTIAIRQEISDLSPANKNKNFAENLEKQRSAPDQNIVR